jgi:hypothetical protein
MFTSLTILASAIMFKVWNSATITVAFSLDGYHFKNSENQIFTFTIVFSFKLSRAQLQSLVCSMQDWDQQSAAEIITELCGFVTILSGTFLLHATKDMGDSSSNMGLLYSPFTPNFCAVS